MTHLAEAEPEAGKRVFIGMVVERHDGMTWDAERVRAAVSAEIDRRNWRLHWLSGSSKLRQGPLEEIAALLGGERPVLAAARASGIVTGRRRDWGWWALAAVVVIVCGVLATLLTRLATGTGVGATLGLLALVGLVNLVGRDLGPGALPLFGSRAKRRVEEFVTKDPEDSDLERRFQRELLRALAKGRRNCAVVVDDFGVMRRRTREVIENHLKGPSKRGPEELWMVFERGSRPSRAARRARRQTSAPYIAQLSLDASFQTWQCRQQPLSLEEKRRVVRRLSPGPVLRENPRLRYRGVADVARDVSDEAAAHEVREQLVDAEPIAVRGFALLAFAAVVPDPADLRQTDLMSVLPNSSSSSGAPPARLLLDWFPEDWRKQAAIQDALDLTVEELEPLFEEHPHKGNPHKGNPRKRNPRKGHLRKAHDRSVEVTPAYADALAGSYRQLRKDHGLPSADGAHAFWALYWHRRLSSSQGWSATVAERTITHIRALREPAQMRNRCQPQVVRALCEAAIAAIEASLALCVPGIVGDFEAEDEEAEELDHSWSDHGLIDRAYLLLAGQSSEADGRLMDRLLDTAWTAYMLTGNGGLLETISALAAERGIEAPPRDRLVDVYLETVPRDGDAPPPLPPDGEGARAAIVDHARTRAVWLAEIVEPLTHDDNSDWFAASAAEASLALGEVMGRMAQRSHAGRASATESLDLLTLAVVGLWLGLRRLRTQPIDDALSEQFEAALQAAAEQRGERAAPGAATNFVLDGLLRQVEATGRAAGAELEGLHMMWHSLELFELADLTALGRNLFALSERKDAEDGVADYLVGLDDTEDRPVNRIESEMLAGVERLDENVNTGGLPLIEAGCATIESQLGPILTFELSKLLAMQHFEVAKKQRERLLEAALETPPGQRGVLDVEEESVSRRLLALLNCVDDSSSATAARLAEVARRRRKEIRNPWYADRVDQALEYAKVGHYGAPEGGELSELLDRWRTRIWDPGLPPSVVEDRSRSVAHVGHSSSPGPEEVIYTYDFLEGKYGTVTADLLELYAGWTRDTYAYVLQRVWSAAGRPEVGIVEDAILLLEEHENPHTHLGYLILAYAVSVHLVARDEIDSPEFRLAVAILRDGIGSAQTSLRPSRNCEIYELLAAHDRERMVDHLARVSFWRTEHKRLAEEPLFLQYANRRYFEIFWHHFLHSHELPYDLDRETILMPCEAGDGHVPDPLIFNGNDRPVLISGAFMRVGHDLFYLDPSSEARDDARVRVHKLAQQNIWYLYDLLIEKNAALPELRKLFERQRRRFEEM
jgi:hypothetical protein